MRSVRTLGSKSARYKITEKQVSTVKYVMRHMFSYQVFHCRKGQVKQVTGNENVESHQVRVIYATCTAFLFTFSDS
jgi:hypothetical protein